MANQLDCSIVISKFKLLSCHYIHLRVNSLGKRMNSLFPSKGLNIITTRLVLVLYNPWRLICHLTKKPSNSPPKKSKQQQNTKIKANEKLLTYKYFCSFMYNLSINTYGFWLICCLHQALFKSDELIDLF